MRAAFLVSAAYEGSSQIPPLPSATLATDIVERTWSEPDCAFKTRRLANERQLPIRLTEAITQLVAPSTLLLFVSGYVTISKDRGSALLLDGERLKALTWAKIGTLLHSAKARTLVLVDAVSMPGTQAPLEQISASIGAALVDPNETTSALVAVRSAFTHPPEAAHFANLLVAVTEYLSTHNSPGTQITEQDLFEAMRRERASFWKLGSAALYPGHGEFPLSTARGTGAETEQLPAWQLDDLKSTPGAPRSDSHRPSLPRPLDRPSPAIQPLLGLPDDSERGSSDGSDSRDSDLDVPTPRRAFLAEQRDAGRPSTASATATPLAAGIVPTEGAHGLPEGSPATQTHSGRPELVADAASGMARISTPFDVLRDSWSGVRHEALETDDDSRSSSRPSVPSSNLRNRSAVAPDGDGFTSSAPCGRTSQKQDRELHLGSGAPQPPSDSRPPSLEPAPDSIPPSIPSAAWSGLFHPAFDQEPSDIETYQPASYASDSTVDEPEMDATQLIRAAAWRPAEPLTDSETSGPSQTTSSILGPRRLSPTLPPAPLGAGSQPPPGAIATSPPPPPGAIRRTLAPPPSRVRTPSHAPPSPGSIPEEEFAPVSSRELQAAVLAHLDSAERRAAANDLDTAIEHLKRALALGITVPLLQADVRCKLAGMLVAQERTPDAIAELELATQLNPDHPTAGAQLIRLLRDTGGDVRLRALCEERLRATLDHEERVALMDVLAQSALDRGDPNLAAKWLRDRVEVAPALGSLEALSDAHRRAGNWTAFVDTQLMLADALSEVPERQALALGLAARVLAEHLADELRAVQLVERAWRADPSTIGPLLDATGFCDSQAGTSALIHAHESALQSLTNSNSVTSLALACSGLYQNKLHDPAGAAHAVSAAIHKAPNSAPLRVELSRLYCILGVHDLATEQARAALLLDPLLAEAYTALSVSVPGPACADLAWRAASVAVGLGSAEESAVTLVRAFSQRALPAPSRVLTGDDWKRIAHAIEPRPPSERLGRCLLLVHRAVRAACAKAQGPRPDWMKSGQEIELATSTATLARSVVWASRFLGTDAPRLWIADDVTHLGCLVMAPEPALLVSRELTSGLSLAESAFLAARFLAYARPEWFLLGLLGDPVALFDWLELCVAVAAEHPLPSSAVATRKVIRILQAELRPEVRSELLALIADSTVEWLRSEVSGLFAHVARVAGRVGMLACGDPCAALALCTRLPQPHITPAEQLADLSRFAVSQCLGELRDSLGLAIGVSLVDLPPNPAPSLPI